MWSGITKFQHVLMDLTQVLLAALACQLEMFPDTANVLRTNGLGCALAINKPKVLVILNDFAFMLRVQCGSREGSAHCSFPGSRLIETSSQHGFP